MSMDCTALYIAAVFYDAVEDKIVEVPLRIKTLDLDLFNDEFANINDVKRIRFKGDIKISTDSKGYILLGCL